MPLRAIQVSDDPVAYFASPTQGDVHLRIANVVLRANKNPREVFSRVIRLAAHRPFSHSALIYLVSDSEQGFDNTFQFEAVTKNRLQCSHWSSRTPRPRRKWPLSSAVRAMPSAMGAPAPCGSQGVERAAP